jgi:NADH-quinone oxidoreductase subunit N
MFSLFLILLTIFFFKNSAFNYFAGQNLLSFLFLSISIFGGFCVMYANDFIFFLISIELLSLSSLMLFFSNSNTKAILAAFKYSILNAAGTIFILLSIAFAFFGIGVSSFSDYIQFITLNSTSFPLINKINFLFSFFFFFGILIKFGLFPFHYWVIEIYPSVSKFAVIYLSIFLKLPFFPLLIGLVPILSLFSNFIFPLLFMSIFVSSFLVFKEAYCDTLTFRKMMAYSSINNLSLLFLSFFSQNFFVIFFYTFVYFLTTLFIFIFFFDITDVSGSELLKFQSSNIKLTVSKYSVFLFFFSLVIMAGLPPFGIFLPKVYLFSVFVKLLPYSVNISSFLVISLLIANFAFVYAYFKFAFHSYFFDSKNFLENFIILKSFKDFFLLRPFIFSFYVFFSLSIPLLFILK